MNAIADLFVEQREQWNQAQDKRDRIDVAIRDHARYASVYSPKTKINVLAGGVLGALIGSIDRLCDGMVGGRIGAVC